MCAFVYENPRDPPAKLVNMSDVPTNFPPQTYSSSFFLNNLTEEDKCDDSLRRKFNFHSDKPESSTFFDCFIRSFADPKPK